MISVGCQGVRTAVLLAVVATCGGVSLLAAQGPASSLPGVPVTRIEGGGSVTQPAQPPPQRPPGLPPLPATQLEDRTRALLDGPSTLTMNFPKPLPVKDVLHLLVTGTPFSVVVDPDVTATFAGELKDVTMRQALEAVLVPLGLDYTVNENVIRVFARRAATRRYDINFLNVRRSWVRGVQSVVGLHGAPSAAHLSSAVEADVLEDLTRGVQSLLSVAGRMHLDRKAGLLQVTDFADRLDEVGVYVEAVELRTSRQVRIEAQVIEVAITDAAASSIDWSAVRAHEGVQASPATAGLRAASMKVLIDAIAKQGTVKTIAAPQVLAMNNEPAVMRVGTQEVSFHSASSLGDDNGRTSPASGVFAGLTLTVVPQIAADGVVQLSVSPTYSSKTGQVKAPGGGTVPVLTINEADSVMRVQEGETVVIAGWLAERERVGRGSGVAALFGGESRQPVKSELVILLTPRIVVPGGAGNAGLR